MKEAFVSHDLNVEIRDVEVPKPERGQVLIKVVVSGTNPKDWKMPQWMLKDKPAQDSGDDIAGYVEGVGEGVSGFAKGDRVAAFHEMMKPHGSFAQYAIAWDYCTFHLPEATSFEEGATIPLAGMTAALGLFQNLGLPLPFRPATAPLPLVVYGGSTAVGAFAIKLAKASNIYPIIAVAGKAQDFVSGLLDKSKGDVVLDYRSGDDAVVSQIKEALEGQRLLHAYDTVTEGSTTTNVLKVLDPQGRVTTVLPTDEIKDDRIKRTMVGSVHDPQAPLAAKNLQRPQPGDPEFGAAFFKLFSWGLAHGWFTPHPYRVVEGGLAGVQQALQDLKDNKASAFKYVLRIDDTPGLSS